VVCSGGLLGVNLILSIELGLIGGALLALLPLETPLLVVGLLSGIVSGAIDAYIQWNTHKCHDVNPWEVGYAFATGGVLGMLGGWAGGGVLGGEGLQQLVGGLLTLPYGILAGVVGGALFSP